MKTIYKVVGNFRVWAVQIQDNLVSCDVQYNNDFNSRGTGYKEIIFKTNNVEMALNKYVEMLESGKLERDTR